MDDLSAEVLEATLPSRPIRTYPALVSTEADALAWARKGAPEGAIVVADYQASPRGRAGLEWHVRPARDLAFSLVLRPQLPLDREGWLYTVAVSGLADVLDGTIEWPDEVRVAGARAGSVGVHVHLGAAATEWAVVNVFVADAEAPRAPLLARLVEAIEARYRSAATPVLADYLRRLDTLGRTVSARLIPLGPGGVRLTGRAVKSLPDGALVLETEEGRRIAVRPQNLGLLE